MNHAELAFLRNNHPAWALLCADHAPLILGFLGRVFIESNAGGIPASQLESELDDELFALNGQLGEGTFPRTARDYLNDWAAPERGWLRKYYPSGSDEARYDVAPPVEKAMTWVRDLRAREFIGTESRLNTIFDLLRQMVYGAETNPHQRLQELQRQRVEIETLISRAERGDIDVLDAVGQRDRYQQFASTARELLADFREVEENFRQLDRRLRAQITGWDGSKGELLDEIVGNRSSIAESDQGRSFRAFYDFLLSSERQAELSELLLRLEQIDSIEERDQRMTRIHFDWIDASERTQATVRLLSEQLRRFLDDQVWLENRRVFELLRSIESNALRARDIAAPAVPTELDEPKVAVALPTERPLYRRSRSQPISVGSIERGENDFDASILLEQIYVDQEELLRNVFTALADRSQVPLEDVVAREPLRHGLAELIGYLSLHQSELDVIFDSDGRARIVWTGEGGDRVADLPRVTFAHRVGDAS